MVMELHTWGPAFSLPSLDPECLAAIAYIDRAAPQGQWVLIASSDPGCSPTNELPALRDGERIIGGFQNIVDYLRQKSSGEWDLDQHFTNSKDLADITAFSSHIQTHLSSLLSLSLYVSSENYTTTTRPAYSTLLPWPTQYVIPPQHRSHAKTTTQHLNLSSLDLDTLDDDTEERNRRKLADVVPAALRTSRQTVMGLVKKQGKGLRFRLDALVDAACEPLAQLLGDKKYFLSDDEPSSLDCLALGYLALALKPELPQGWLQESMRSRYPGLCAFVARGVEECWGGEVRVKDALLEGNASVPAVETEQRRQTALPWRASTQTGTNAAGTTILNSLLTASPFKSTILSPPIKDANTADTTISSPTAAFMPVLIAATSAVAAMASYFLYANTLPAESEKRDFRDMGEAGRILAGLDLGGAEEVERGGVNGVEMRDNIGIQEKGL